MSPGQSKCTVEDTDITVESSIVAAVDKMQFFW